MHDPESNSLKKRIVHLDLQLDFACIRNSTPYAAGYLQVENLKMYLPLDMEKMNENEQNKSKRVLQ